jgi:transposase
MNSEKYIGLDVHQATISVAVLDSTGKLVMESILETKAATILEFFAGLRGTLSVTFEEGTWAAWLYDLLNPHVAKLVVCNPRKNALLKDGNKSDRIDAHKLAELLYLNKLSSVYHGETGVRMLRELARSYLTIVKDLTRVMSRLKAVYRSWARSRKPASVAEPNDSTSNWTCCSTCASKCAASCWRRVASMPSPSNYGRFPRWDRFAPPWRWR